MDFARGGGGRGTMKAVYDLIDLSRGDSEPQVPPVREWPKLVPGVLCRSGSD